MSRLGEVSLDEFLVLVVAKAAEVLHAESRKVFLTLPSSF
jgi:hypothetical protein